MKPPKNTQPPSAKPFTKGEKAIIKHGMASAPSAEQRAREIIHRVRVARDNVDDNVIATELTTIIAERDELKQSEQVLPETFYAGLSFSERIKQMWNGWHNAIKCTIELEAELGTLQLRVAEFEKDKARLDFLHNLLLRKTVHAVCDFPDPEYAGTYVLKERNRVLGEGNSIRTAIDNAMKGEQSK